MRAIKGNYKNKDILSISQFDKEDIKILFEKADFMKMLIKEHGGSTILHGKLLSNLFYESSTRTSSSFSAAVQRLGGSIIQINDVNYSSVIKGENLPDTVRTLQSYSDIIVLRHPKKGSAKIAADSVEIPVINAGDGIGEHPTQALLDLYTIQQECGKLDGITITMVGDLKNGRTVHSLAKLLSMYKVNFNFIAPSELQMPTDIRKFIGKKNKQLEGSEIKPFLKSTDVLYVTRIQKERFESQEEYQRLKDCFIITPKLLKNAPKGMTVMHPLPRVNEIDEKVDKDPRAAYFRQMENGLYIRMALIALVFGK